ncbi:hypothetical protein [Streptomyces sp. NBC_00268]|uniref:hypothetical protein n=1 Tax=Streptomyces sp. NBC_00268 TaxID=2975695 RepID=UPI0022506805|nr:hypothetical protein [Streptomyces sp. NBC_00268]MCX5182583.1 hypothetical protein [Streptomyces sp. NBC_00268]
MITATERAEHMALQVFISAREHNGRVVTHDMVDAVMSRDADTEQGKANVATVRRIIRRKAEAEGVRVIFTAEERYWAIREQLHHMSADAVHALRDDITNGGDSDPRGWDAQLTDAISARLSNRPTPARLWGCTPVSIRLWRQPRPESPILLPDDVVDAPHTLFIDDRQIRTGIPAERVRKIVNVRRFAGRPTHQDGDKAIVCDSRRYVPAQTAGTPALAEEQRPERFHMRTVNGGTPERIPSADARHEMNNAMMQPGKRAVRTMSAGHSTARIVYKDNRGEVLLRPATPEEAAMDVKPESERYAPGDLVTVRPVVYDPEKRTHRVFPEYTGTVVSWGGPNYYVRSVVADEHGHGVRPCRVHELRPATAEAAPLFAALAAYEAAALCSTPRDLEDLAHHLLALGKVAPTAQHLEIVEAQAAVEDAWEALRTAQDLTARNAAHDQVRAAVKGARAVILAVAPHAHRMHGTDMPATADTIRAAALAYNAVGSTPEELSAVETGTPQVRVHCACDSGTGWTVKATITAGVDSPVGFIPAHPPVVVKFRKRDGRQDAAVNARRVIGALFRVDVPVEYVLDRRV